MSKNPHFRLRPVKPASMLLILTLTLTIVHKASLSTNQQESSTKKAPAVSPDEDAAKKKEPLETMQAREMGPVAQPEVSQPLVGPNLTPFRPTGWSDKIVVSTVPGSHSDSFPLREIDTLFVDWAVINNGTSSTPVRFHTRLFVDGFERATWFTDPPLGVNFFAFVDDFSIGTLSPGTHTLRIVADVFNEIAESSELDNEYIKTINVTSSGQPNLSPFTPSGWSDRIVVSTSPGNHTDSSPLRVTDTLFVDWAVLNNGNAVTPVRFRTRLFVDGLERATWFTDPPLGVNFFAFVDDFSIGTLSPGTHTLRIVADVFGEIQESNEFDNEYTKTISISSAGQPNITPFTPSGWSDRIVVSTSPGNHTDSSSLRATDTLFVDWAVANNGTAAATARFHTKLFVDGVEKTSWFTEPPLNADFFTFIEDFSIGTLSPGTHTLRIVTDALNVIPESNEGDNEYTKTISIVASQTCHTVTTNVSPSNGGTTTRSPQGACASALVLVDTPNFMFGSISPAPSSAATALQLGRGKHVADAFRNLISKAEAEGTVRVIIGLDAAFEPEGYLDGPQAVIAQRDGIRRAQDDLINRLVIPNTQSIKRFRTIPFIAMELDSSGLRYLENSPDVTSIEEDVAVPPALEQSVSIIGAPAAWASGFRGAGQTIAILDSGVDKNHPFLAGKVVSEGCYSTTGPSSSSVCPGGAQNSISAGSGVPCTVNGCDHGTHVAGIAAGNGDVLPGVARDANIIALQVFSRFNSQSDCGERPAPCSLAFVSDQISALERVEELAASFNIAAVNMSLGGGRSTSHCDLEQASRKRMIDNLRSRQIATVISSGNEGFTDAMGSPACISSAISVGSTGDGTGETPRDRVSDFSNSASFLNLLAPGDLIRSSIPGGGIGSKRGTSMAAPHVAGAWAVIKSKAPSATVDQVLAALVNTGVPITDTRNGIVKPRIQLDSALNAIGGGGGGGGAAQYRSGTTVTMTATPNAGFVFEKWQRDGVDFSTSATINVVVSANSTMTAVFRPVVNNDPRINTASFQSPKTMRIFGASFGSFPRVFINGIEKSSFITVRSDASITMKGKSKKLGLRTGNNNVQVVTASGTGSNIFVLTL